MSSRTFSSMFFAWCMCLLVPDVVVVVGVIEGCKEGLVSNDDRDGG